ncbi:NAD-dependent epimerase/dehydratase family protein [Streptomyces europaeiscabiei]|uniref:NAD-dependent epimerase/dehydratase family protein n=1 Tax=Streptomyces TaxID=1883 RepID=UPI00211B0F7B|nr:MULTISPECIES: NAD-dependent epimerase/dehydratase family protein [Streptomyces]MDX3586813.1 NAD-dependent epimerase/dehydratase family protein [Streptomyces europaeiscabiei]MDX3636317.1 NAD-dependent epimerase/dehydratase family protein [Streptomyces europaeiscabiei]MDX3647537.1 NAD-dependent epimerase/dehydratase family protein [Streptomyces europaeiscabiei]WUD32226.1 NAD-dependent epimerase/dehydratase family protein [Streptomyces europaeiscabiei]
MRLLMLGGTEFVGRAVVESALARGWEVTVFHRGRHAPPAGVRSLLGDRTAPDGLAALVDAADAGSASGGGGWDVVVDTWSAAPRAVRDTARLLSGVAERYVYVSSCSVYAWPPAAGYDERAPLVDGGSADADATDYARDKRGGELATVEAFGVDRSLLVRCGLILGPYENIGRLPWWLNRAARGGPVLAPGPRDLPLQYVDVRDLAAWILGAAEHGSSGAYNLIGPSGTTTMGELLDTCVRVTGGAAELRWTAPESILDAGIEPWTQLPVWVPEGSDLHDALHRADVSRAVRDGLRCRDVEETVRDTWEWLTGLGGVAPRRPDRPAVGLDASVEAKVLGL